MARLALLAPLLALAPHEELGRYSLGYFIRRVAPPSSLVCEVGHSRAMILTCSQVSRGTLDVQIADSHGGAAKVTVIGNQGPLHDEVSGVAAKYASGVGVVTDINTEPLAVACAGYIALLPVIRDQQNFLLLTQTGAPHGLAQVVRVERLHDSMAIHNGKLWIGPDAGSATFSIACAPRDLPAVLGAVVSDCGVPDAIAMQDLRHFAVGPRCRVYQRKSPPLSDVVEYRLFVEESFRRHLGELEGRIRISSKWLAELGYSGQVDWCRPLVPIMFCNRISGCFWDLPIDRAAVVVDPMLFSSLIALHSNGI